MAKDTRQQKDQFQAFWALLRWEGELRNGRLQQLLSHTSVHISRLIGSFREANPGLLENDQVEKRWVPRGTVALPDIPVDDYLAVLREHGDSTASYLVDARPQFLSPPAPFYAMVRRACLVGSGLEIRYASLSQPTGSCRVIYPTAIVRLSQRWHIRAWCASRQEYRDFNFGRIRAMQPMPAPSAQLPTDVGWTTIVPIRLVPHRKLSPEVHDVVRAEYVSGAAVRCLEVRAALVHYVIQDIRAALDPERDQPPHFLLEVINLDEVAPYLFNEI